jgi:hypothetical protein
LLIPSRGRFRAARDLPTSFQCRPTARNRLSISGSPSNRASRANPRLQIGGGNFHALFARCCRLSLWSGDPHALCPRRYRPCDRHLAITFPQMAYAQTNAIHVIISPVGDMTPATQAPACTSASCQKLVPRYPKSPTYMLGILEYNTVNCTQNTPGQWTGFPNTTSNKGEISTGFAQGTPPPCAPPGLWTYAVIYFNWTAHNNHSMPSPSLVDGFPMDQFNATWIDPNTDGFTQSCNCTGRTPTPSTLTCRRCVRRARHRLLRTRWTILGPRTVPKGYS